MMKRMTLFVALLWPFAAGAEQMYSDGLVALFYWYILLGLLSIAYLIFGPHGWIRKIVAVSAGVLAATAVLLWMSKHTISGSEWIEISDGLAVGVAPLAGFVLGFYLAKPKTSEQSEIK